MNHKKPTLKKELNKIDEGLSDILGFDVNKLEPAVPPITMTTSGTVYDGLLETIEENDKLIKSLNKDLDQLNSERRFAASIVLEAREKELREQEFKISRLQHQVQTLAGFLDTQLKEWEDSDNEITHPLEDQLLSYQQAATHMMVTYGRHANVLPSVEQRIEEIKFERQTSNVLFDNMSNQKI